MEDHYFGSIKPRIQAFMNELNEELWKLGILAKTEHNEVAPAQHELAPIFASTNVATDHNQLTMEFMRKVAARHGLVCLLHEKPFAGVNGSGKHNNWSMSTDTGVNLLEPGDNPSDNAQFLLFLCAVIKAVDENQDLLRITVASAGNDHRLGASEAPPAIISMFLGDDLTEMLTAIEGRQTVSAHEKTRLDIGVNVTPRFSRDTTDRNRTSPFAFTGNKFEFRSLGSSFSIAGPNIILNTIVGDALRQFADRLEAAEDFNVELNRIVRHTMRDHKRIIFNGNNYSDEWRAEAARRGLLNYPSAVDALPHFTDEKNVALFTRYGIFSETEIRSRRDILLENYIKVIHIEALTMQDMVNRDLRPAILRYTGFLTDNALKKAQLGLTAVPEKAMAEKLSALSASIVERSALLSDRLLGAADAGALIDEAKYYKDSVFSVMNELRAVVDETELLMPTDVWPYPTYGKLLFDVR